MDSERLDKRGFSNSLDESDDGLDTILNFQMLPLSCEAVPHSDS
jgi:hypothetical protein